MQRGVHTAMHTHDVHDVTHGSKHAHFVIIDVRQTRNIVVTGQYAPKVVTAQLLVMVLQTDSVVFEM